MLDPRLKTVDSRFFLQTVKLGAAILRIGVECLLFEAHRGCRSDSGDKLPELFKRISEVIRECEMSVRNQTEGRRGNISN